MSEPARSRHATIAAVAVVAATYLYFLLFAEFALLRLVAPGWSFRVVMAALGVGGVGGSVAAARVFSRWRLHVALAAGFLVAAFGAALALAAGSGYALWLAAWLTGLGLGWLTVILAAGLRALVGDARLGLVCGLGTGLAYAGCNLPAVFAAAPAVQTAVAAAVALAGAALTPWLEVRAEPREAAADFRRGPAVAWIGVLLTLVWLDSAAFFIIQHTPALKAVTWAGAWTLEGNALMHFGAAVAAGLALDRGRRMGLLVLAGALLVGACAGLAGGGAVWAPLLYTAGVSVYSTVLIYYPARSGRPGLTATVYVAAGWIGSALGIGMAQDLQRIPSWFLALAAAVILTGWAGRRRFLLGGLAALALAGPRLRAADDAAVRRGRQVYIAEGCIHCHSQYVRPGVAADVARWGPAQAGNFHAEGDPPLLGNRRDGPDLTNVGNRRSVEWLRLHQMHPRQLTPGSRMPDYAYLFAGADPRGQALVAYLASLGSDTVVARAAEVETWRPAVGLGSDAETARARRLFAELCANCHGATGRGDGPLAGQLSERPPDFRQERWRHVAANESVSVLTVARVIKYGAPGTPMAGREYLDDADAVALARFVITLHRPVQPL